MENDNYYKLIIMTVIVLGWIELSIKITDKLTDSFPIRCEWTYKITKKTKKNIQGTKLMEDFLVYIFLL